MATDKLPIDDLPGDLPEDWKLNDAVTPTGTDAGLSDKHGYNYLMKAVNAAHKKLNALIKALRDNLHAIAYSGSYNDLLNKPSTFPPRTHTHTKVQITDFPTSLPANGGNADTVPWSGVSNKPSVYPPESHSHTPSQVGLGNVSNDAQVKRSEMGSANGVATLDSDGTLPVEQIPTSVLNKVNLLINGDFKIWQRGDTFELKKSGTYTCDRWRCRGGFATTPITVTRTDDGIKLSNNNSTKVSVMLEQIFEYDKNLMAVINTRKLSGSCLIESSANTEGNTYFRAKSKTGVELSIEAIGYRDYNVPRGLNEYSFTFDNVNFDTENTFSYINAIYVPPNGSITVRWIKLELGTNVTPFVPRSYVEEMVDCSRFFQQRRFNQSGYAGIASTGSTQATLYLPLHMRTKPSCTLVSEGSNYNLSHVTPSVASDRVVLGIVAKAIGYYTVYDYIYQLDAEFNI